MAWLDKTGMIASSSCAVHCGLTGVLLAFPAAATWAAPWMPQLAAADPWLVWASLGCAVAALVHGIFRHQRWSPALLGLLGVGTWAASMLPGLTQTQTAVISVMAGGLLVGAHWFNLRCTRQCVCQGTGRERREGVSGSF